jgi:membrane-bound lytic murein transglycosylase D
MRYLQMAGGIALMLGSLACQTGTHSTALLPAKQASAPAISAPPVAQAKAETKPTAPIAPAPPEVKTDPAADLIVQVEKEYQAGQANYQAGHLDAAKENFDRAFNLLLESPLDVGADERLQNEFDRLLDGVNGLEMQALQQGDGFTEQKSEPAPIDEANEVTYPVDPNIKAKAEAEIK